tara:strand:+ start:183 stop:527 length:345 start_codon:yes stop_codon:yes gene_type:complete
MISDHQFYTNVGRWIKFNRLKGKKVITQSKLANYLGVTFQQVQKYERAKNYPSFYKILKVCKFFNVDPMKQLIFWMQDDSVKTAVVSLKEIAQHPTKRMDASYWIARKGGLHNE